MKLFSTVGGSKIPRNKFDLSHEKKLTMSMNNLVPIVCQEIVPGDSFKLRTEMLIRLQPMIAPMYHRLKAKIEYYFVPNRLVYDKWQEFITGGEDGASTEVPPFIAFQQSSLANLVAKGSLADYMGLPAWTPSTMANPIEISALPFRAYQLIYNEYYRDQNLQPKVNISKAGGAAIDAEYILTMRQRAWEKDYFTSSLPFAQKGDPVNIPTEVNYKNNSIAKRPDGANSADGALSVASGAVVDSGTTGVQIQNLEDIGITVNDLRTSVRVQEWLEKNARAGSRYIESILQHFGILSSDARLQRPEFLGGGMTPIVVSEVLSSYQQADDTGYPLGTMGGHGIAVGNQNGFTRKFEEHGFVIGLLSVLPTTAYQQGIPKTFLRKDKFDYYWPSFANLGEQEVKIEELYYDPTTYNPNVPETFGYQSRYAEYKYQPSTVHGDFKDTLSFWHMGRIFANKPVLNDSFIKADASKRIFAVESQTEDELLVSLYHDISAIRPMPYYGTPRL